MVRRRGNVEIKQAEPLLQRNPETTEPNRFEVWDYSNRGGCVKDNPAASG